MKIPVASFVLASLLPSIDGTWHCHSLDVANCDEGSLFCVQVSSNRGRKLGNKLVSYADDLDSLEEQLEALVVDENDFESERELSKFETKLKKKADKTTKRLSSLVSVIQSKGHGECIAKTKCKQGTLLEDGTSGLFSSTRCYLPEPGPIDEVSHCPAPLPGWSISLEMLPYMICEAFFIVE